MAIRQADVVAVAATTPIVISAVGISADSCRGKWWKPAPLIAVILAAVNMGAPPLAVHQPKNHPGHCNHC